MKRSFAQRVVSFVRRKFCLPPLLASTHILGHQVLVPEGTIRETPHYDDAWLFACALHSEVIFDVGANIGQSALVILMAECVKQIVLVEPNPEALSIAAGNLVRNQLSTKARLVSAFASDVDNTRMKFWTVGAGAAGSMYRTMRILRQGPTALLRCQRLPLIAFVMYTA